MVGYRRGIVLILMMLCFLTASTVFASDINDTVISDDMGDDLTSLIEDNALLQDSKSFTQLNQDINGNPDRQINLTSDYAYGLEDSDLSAFG